MSTGVATYISVDGMPGSKELQLLGRDAQWGAIQRRGRWLRNAMALSSFKRGKLAGPMPE